MSTTPDPSAAPDKPLTEEQKQVFDALKLLIDFQKWTYDTFQRDSNFFLAIEVVLFGGVANTILAKSPLDRWTFGVAFLGVLLGLFLTVLWAGRQRREFYLAKGRLEHLKALESRLPECFHYFTTIFPDSQRRVAESKPLPLIGGWCRIVPNLYRRSAFLDSIVLQQALFLAWVGLGVVVLLRVFGSS